jgi:predicted porin
MKRSILIAALATLSAGTALAQSSVSIYGRLNLTVENRKVNGVSEKGLFNNASRVGFRGVEDLGGGLKAGFVLEHGFNPDDGTQSQTAFWARQSEVSLAGGFGQVRLGNFVSEAYFATADYIAMHNHDTGISSDAFYAYIGRNTDKISYRLPSFGNLSIEAAVSLRDRPAATNRTFDLAANYKSGPLHLGAGYEKNGNAKQMAVRGLYEMGALTLGAYLQRDTNGYSAAGGNRTTTRLSAAYAVGSGSFHADVGRAGAYSRISGSSASQYTLGYNHNLSKRTKVYTFYTKVDDKGRIYGDVSSLAVGVRHNF